jgi:hypothetical protein
MTKCNGKKKKALRKIKGGIKKTTIGKIRVIRKIRL